MPSFVNEVVCGWLTFTRCHGDTWLGSDGIAYMEHAMLRELNLLLFRDYTIFVR